MIRAINVSKSTKRLGKYEKRIVDKLIPYFLNGGYEVVPHARLNISWGSIISDLDLLLLKQNKLTLIEIKSSRDKLSRAKTQIQNIQDYVDYAYVATDYYPNKWNIHNVGLLVVDDSEINVVKKAKEFTRLPTHDSLASLQKKCLARLAGISDDCTAKQVGKLEIVRYIEKLNDGHRLKSVMKEIVTCGMDCNGNCPIWNFTHTQVQ